MKMKSFKRVLALALATAMVLTACGQKPAANTSETTKTEESIPAKESEAAPSEEKKEEPKEPVAITLYPKDANLFSGEVTGYRGEALAEHGIKLEVWAYSDEKTTAMMTSGDFPDMMYVAPGTQPDIFETLVQTDKIIDYSDYAEFLPHVLGDKVVNKYITSNLDHIRENYSAGIVPACWKMVYAADEAEFEAIWDQMVADAETMGAKEIFDWFKENFKPNK